MNPRPLLWLLLAGCAAPRKQEPPPPPPTVCPMGHAELKSGPVGPDVIETIETLRPGDIGLVCGRCGYGCYPGNRVWTREAKSLDGFAFSPSELMRRLHVKASGAKDFSYRQTSAGRVVSEDVSFTLAGELWPLLRPDFDALGARGSFEDDTKKFWAGRLGDLELNAYLYGGRPRVTLQPPVSQADIDRAFRDAFTPR